MAGALAHWGGHQARGQPTFRQQFSSAAAVMSARALAKCHKTTSPAIKGLPPKGKHLCGHLTVFGRLCEGHRKSMAWSKRCGHGHLSDTLSHTKGTWGALRGFLLWQFARS